MTGRDSPGPKEGAPPAPTAELFVRAREGDAAAREEIFRRYMPNLRRFAHGRTPALALGLVDTDDFVQETMLRAFTHLERFEARGPGAFFAFLRRILLNQIHDQARRASRRPRGEELPEEMPDAGPSPLEEVIGREALDAYEAALARLSDDSREAIVLRIELGFTHAQVAEVLGRPSSEAARALVTRALLQLAEEMRPVREQ